MKTLKNVKPSPTRPIVRMDGFTFSQFLGKHNSCYILDKELVWDKGMGYLMFYTLWLDNVNDLYDTDIPPIVIKNILADAITS